MCLVPYTLPPSERMTRLYQMYASLDENAVKYVLYESRHDKTNKLTVRPAKTQICLGIRPVWSVFHVRMKKA